MRVVMPAYQMVEGALQSGKWGIEALPVQLQVPVGRSLLPAGVLRAMLPGTDVPVYFIAEKNLFDRPNMYGYDDDPYRFSFFSRAALELAPALGWRPDLVHAHDWHSAPAILWLATSGQFDIGFEGFQHSSQFTIWLIKDEVPGIFWIILEFKPLRCVKRVMRN